MMISWILGVHVEDIAKNVLYFSTTRDIWLNLEERYDNRLELCCFLCRKNCMR